MAVHRKAVALMDPIEAVARLAARAGERAESAQTRASGSASYDNGDGTRTIIGPQTGSATIATHVGDVTPPPVPTGIRAWSGDGSLHVLWAGSLAGDVPADFDHVTVLVDGAPVAEMRSAGSVTVDGLAVGSAVSVTATAEDDACLADGTPAHNVSAPCAAVKVAIRDAVAEVRADADAHGEQIGAIREDIAAYKASAQATYATKTEVDERTGAITKTLAADYTRTADLAATEAVKAAKKAGTDAQGQLADYKESNDAAVAAAKKSGDDAAAALDGYKATVSKTYAEKTELTEAVNQLSSTMSSNYSAFTDYRKSNDTALSKAQTDATNAQSTIDSYKSSNDKAVADAKAAGTTAQSQLSSYRSSNDAAVAAAKKAGTDAQSNLDAYRGTTDQRLDELRNIADNAIETWYLKGVPTASNAPAKDWTTDALKKRHAGDLYMDTDTGYSYRWSGSAWVQVKDSDVTKALREIAGIKTDYATKSELSATDTELSGKVSDALTTAKSYTDSSVEQEVTARNAAIKAQADSISLDVSRTYTRSDTFSAYQSDADGRIATANANASTAVSTAKTAASAAATAKTNASSAVSTANSASSTASKASTDAAAAVKTANAASSNASSAVSTANGAVSTANSASSTANAAKSTVNGMKLGGRNLLKGTSMDSKAVTTPTTASTTWGSGFAFPADASLRAVIPYGAEYRCSVDVLLPIDGRIVVDMNTYAEVGTSWAGNDNDNNNRRTANAFNVKANVWTRISWGSENTNDANAGKQAIYVNDSVGLLPQSAAVTWHYRGLKVELGNKATDWTPAPEDTDSAVADAKKAAATAQSSADAAQSTADTAKANAATAVSTAKTAASDAATAKTDASSAVSTANSANTKSESAVSTANSAVSTANTAKSTADAAKTSASSAVSTANAASSTASAAKSTADTAKSTADSANAAAGSAQSTADAAKSAAATAQSSADAAQSTADDAWVRTLRVQVSSAPADAAGDTSTLTATVWRGGELLSDEAVARMGLLAWYVGGSRVATGGTYTCAAGTAVECRMEA